jgi:hypothetical protein
MERDCYVIGKSPMPDWCARRLMQYKKMDGTTGYEWHYTEFGAWRSVELIKGDVLVRRGDVVYFKRR